MTASPLAIACLSIGFAAALMAQTPKALAGAFSVVPQIVKLEPSSPTNMVEVKNNADVETVFQVETFAWRDSPALEALETTRELLAVPAVFRLAPGAKQTIRVAARVKPGQHEKSYRLLISEVPAAGESGGVVFALRMSLPVFLSPQGAKASLNAAFANGGNAIELVNNGTAHLRLEDVKLVDNATGRLQQTLSLQQPAYLLPGQSQSYDLTSRVSGKSMIVEADTTAGPFQFQVSD